MIDVHCHLNFHAFENDADQVIREAFEAGVKAIVNVGTKIDSSRKAVELAEKYDQLYAIVGIHPHHADKPGNDWLYELEKMAKFKKVIGIGEIGLDYFPYKSNGIVDPKVQKEIFRSQIELSIKLGLPLQIHNRHAGEDIVRILSDYKDDFQDPPGMFHCFAGSHEVLKNALELGFYIGFDGNITYKGLAPHEAVTLSELAKATPLERTLVETDSPYLTPIPYRGQRNTPKNAIIIGKFLSELKSVSYEALEHQVFTNFVSVFKT